MVSCLGRDVRYGVRRFCRQPALLWIVAVTLAVGAGTAAAVTQVLQAVILSPLPHPDSDRLVMLQEVWPSAPSGFVSWPIFRTWQVQAHSFETMVAMQRKAITVQSIANPERVQALLVTAGYFRALRSTPHLGRYFVDGDARQGAPPVVVLSFGLWKGSFGADPNIVGRSILLDGQAYTVAGVTPDSFQGDPYPSVEIWVPMQPVGPIFQYGAVALSAFGRLGPGITANAAKAELSVILSRLRHAASPMQASFLGKAAQVVSMHSWETRDVSRKLSLITAAVFLFFAISCTNAGILMFAWTASRASEWRTRIAIGATPARILRQLLAEALVVCMASAFGAGVLTALLFLVFGKRLVRFLPYGLHPHAVSLSITYAVGFSLIAGCLLVLGPALAAAGSHAVSMHSSWTSRTPARTRKLLVSCEIAISMTLVCSAGLVLSDIYNLTHRNMGMQVRGVLAFDTVVSAANYPGQQIGEAYYLPLLHRLAGLPGVLSVGATTAVPIEVGPSSDHIRAAGHFIPLTQRFALRGVMPGYLETLRVNLARGREFNNGDHLGEHPVALINDIAAKTVFDNEDPVGQEIIGATVVGVYQSTVQGLQSRNRLPEIDLCLMQMAPGTIIYDWVTQPVTILVRTSLSPLSLARSVREVTQQLDSREPMYAVRPLTDDIGESIASESVTEQLLGILAGLALLLAGIGIYGVLSYELTNRTREIGVRIALGASPRSILGTVFRRTLEMVSIGVGAGLAGMFAVGLLIRSLLFDVRAFDPLIYVTVIVCVIATATMATFIPAFHAVGIDPAEALRFE